MSSFIVYSIRMSVTHISILLMVRARSSIKMDNLINFSVLIRINEFLLTSKYPQPYGNF